MKLARGRKMTPENFLKRIVDPSLQFLSELAGTQSNDAARVLVMTIAGQESGWKERRQIGGPARGYWQFEKGGGVAGLFQATPQQLRAICVGLDIPFDQTVVFEAMAWNDTLAASMARLLLFTDPAPLPAVGDKDAAWQYYLRNWRPGAPHPASWSGLYDQSLAAMGHP